MTEALPAELKIEILNAVHNTKDLVALTRESSSYHELAYRDNLSTTFAISDLETRGFEISAFDDLETRGFSILPMYTILPQNWTYLRLTVCIKHRKHSGDFDNGHRALQEYMRQYFGTFTAGNFPLLHLAS